MAKSRGVARYAKQQRWSAGDGRVVIAALAESGQSIAEFARATGIVEQRLYYWRKRLESATGARAPAFVEIRHGEPEVVEIALRSGRSVRVPVSIDGAVLRRLIDALEQDSAC